jgi:hypothetical protein
LETGAVNLIVATLPGQDHLTWLKNNILLMSDGQQLFSFQVGVDLKWKEVKMEGVGLLYKNITRLATDADNKKLAIVVAE